MRRKFADVRKAAADKKAAATRDDYRRTYSQNLGRTKFKPTKQRVGDLGNKIIETVRGAGDKTGEGIMGIYDAGAKFMKSLMSNIDRSAQNREILGDVYTDDLRKSMMSDSDIAFYEKYMRLGDMRSGPEAQYYYDIADDGQPLTYTFNISSQNTFGFIFIGSISMGGIMTAIIFAYVYLSKRRSKSKQ